MSVWPDRIKVEKPCRDCGEMMWCTPERLVCTKCRRKAEVEGNRRRIEAKKMADTLALGKSPNPDGPAAV